MRSATLVVRFSYPRARTAVQLADVKQILVEQLAYVRACEPSELRAEIDAAGGDLEIDSKEGQTVAIRVEMVLDMEGLIRPEDQTRENLTTLSSLLDLIERRQGEAKGS